MLENAIEAGLVMGRVREAVLDAGLSGAEAEALIGLPPDGWNAFAAGRPLRAMSVLQETRARLAVEIVRSMGSLLGDVGEVGAWFRAPSAALDGELPLAWVAQDLAHLRVLAQAVRAEADA